MPAAMSQPLWMENLEEYIEQDGQIVTYSWLSRTSKVSANLAKQMLFAYMEQCKDDDAKQVHATYVVSGTVDGARKIKVVDEEGLKAAGDAFKVVHVYSLQKNKPSDYTNAVYTVDAAMRKAGVDVTWAAIGCKQAVATNRGHVLPDVDTSFSSKGSFGGGSEASSRPAQKRGPKIDAKSFFGGKKPASKKASTKKEAAKPKAAAASSKSKKGKPSEDKPKRKRLAIDDDSDSDDADAEEAKDGQKEAAKEAAPAQAPKAAEQPKAAKPKPKAKPASEPAAAEADEASSARQDAAKLSGMEAEPASAEATGDQQEAAATAKPKAEGKKRGADSAAKAKKASKAAKSKEVDDAGASAKTSTEEGEAATPGMLKSLISTTTKKKKIITEKVKKTYMNEKGYMVTEWIDVHKEVEIDDKPPSPKKPTAKLAKKGSASGKAAGKKKQGSMMSFFGKKK